MVERVGGFASRLVGDFHEESRAHRPSGSRRLGRSREAPLRHRESEQRCRPRPGGNRDWKRSPRRTLSQSDVAWSNSMSESWWRSAKRQLLCLNQLGRLAAVERLVAFWVERHDRVMPHAALYSRTPDEVFAGEASGGSRVNGARSDRRGRSCRGSRRCQRWDPGSPPWRHRRRSR